ncbi:MAG: autotransporter-associated beta strand repeat-containing protein [Luteolibacter sp.]
MRSFRFASTVLLVIFWLLPAGGVFAQRQMEKLGRGLVVLRTSTTQTYIGWRLLGNDPEDIAFNVYRSANGGTATKLNSSPITTTTNYVDTPGSLSSTAYTYSVRPVIDSVEVTDMWANSGVTSVTLAANATVRQYIPVPLTAPPDGVNSIYRVKLAWIGDLDGDGEYDFVVERTNTSTTSRQWIQAYKRDGTLLWQMTQGPNSLEQDNIYSGSSTIAVGQADHVTVYDLDGDGKAEVCVVTANGVIFNYGPNQTTLTAANDEVQFISIIDGQTGVEKARAQIPIPASWATQTNLTSGNMGIFYPDGLRPSLFLHAKNRNADLSFNNMAAAWDYRDGAITQRWLWYPQNGENYAVGHQVRFADVDNDGKDEYVDIGMVLKADGSGQLNETKFNEVIHGDRYHVTDIDPDRPGLETFLIQQNNSTGLTMAYHSSDKSTMIKKWYAGQVVDVGRGTVGGFVPDLYGMQFFSTQDGTYDRKGDQVYATQPWPVETIWWDADLGRELMNSNGVAIDKFNTTDPSGVNRQITIYNDKAAPTGNTQADGGRPAFWGDVLGDWREELVCAASDYSELRIYTTKTADTAKTYGGQNFRIYTLMHNPQYRIQATTKGYVQSSYPDYYLGYNMSPPPPPPMVDAKLVWKGGSGSTTWDNGTTASWLNNGVAGFFTSGDTVRFDLSGNNTTSVTLNGMLQPGALTVYSPTDYTFSGDGSLAGSMKLLKAGAGTMVLPGTHSFSGKTTVWDGALQIDGALQNSAVTVWGGLWGGSMAAGKTGGRLAGSGTISQAVTLKYRGTMTPGAGMNSAGTLTLGNGLTAEDGSTLALDLSDDPTGSIKTNDKIAITGNLSLSGTVKIVVNPLNTQLAPGVYTLATYTGSLTGSVSNLSVDVPEGTPYTLSVGSGSIQLTVPTVRAPASLVWRGNAGAWNLATSSNWLRSGSPDVFVAGDTVAFNNTGAGAPTVTLSTALPVAGVTVDGSTNYTFTGAGYISGSGGLTKNGSGTLTISTNNTYTGPTTINGGILSIASLSDSGSPSAIGASAKDAGNFVLNGGTLQILSSQTNMDRDLTLGAAGGTFDIAAGSSIQLSGNVIGSGTMTKSGEGTLLLVGANSYTGNTIINGGRVYLGGAEANTQGLGSGSITINNGRLSMSDVRKSANSAWNIVVPAGATARLDADGRCTLSGSLTGSGDFTFYTPYVRTDLTGNWSAFTGTINVIGPSDGAAYRMANSAGYPNAALNLGENMDAYYLDMSGSFTFPIGELQGVATSLLRGGSTANRTITYSIGGKNTDSTFAGSIRNYTGTTALTKAGTGVLTLTGASTYTGATNVSAGKLVVNGGSLTGTNVTVASGAGFGGNGSVSGNVTFNSGSTLLANPAAGPLAISGNLSLNGTISVESVPGASFAVGSYTLYTYTGTLTGTPTFVWNDPFSSAAISTSTAGQVKIVITPNSLIWTGAATGSWNSTDLNWSAGGGAVAFSDTNRVMFDDSSLVRSVNITTGVSPAALTVMGSQNYTFTGAGSISGAVSLDKYGTGNLTLESSHSFTGGTKINGGSVVLGNAAANGGALGSGNVILNGGTLQLFSLGNSGTSAGTFSNTIQVNSGASGTLIGFGRGNLASKLQGSGTFNYQADYVRADVTGDWSTFTGQINVTPGPYGGDFRVDNFSGFGTAKINLASGVSMYMQANFGSSTYTNTIGELTGSGTLKGGRASTTRIMIWNIGGANTDARFDGVIGNHVGPTAIIKSGTGSWLLTGDSTYTGATTVSNGTLLVTGSLGTTAVSVASGAGIGGTGTLGGDLGIASGGKLTLGVGAASTKGLTVAGTTTLNGAICNLAKSLKHLPPKGLKWVAVFGFTSAGDRPGLGPSPNELSA